MGCGLMMFNVFYCTFAGADLGDVEAGICCEQSGLNSAQNWTGRFHSSEMPSLRLM